MTDLRPDMNPARPDELTPPPGLNGEHRSFADVKDEVRDDAESLLRTLRHVLDSRAHEARQWAAARADRAREAVQDRPATALLGALGVGLIVGLIAGGR